MSITPSNLVQGPAVLYYGAYQASEPADSAVGTAPSSGSWTDLGATDEGLTLMVNREFSELTVDQIAGIAETRLTKVDPQVKTNLAEATLANFSKAMNGGTVTTSGSYATYDPSETEADFTPTYFALIVDGWAPGSSKRRRVILRKCLFIENIEAKWAKDGKFMYPVTIRAHYISSSTKTFHIVDAL